MRIEERPPNKPNFKLILILFAVALLVIFVIAYLTLRWDGKRLVPRHDVKNPTSLLIAPKIRTLETAQLYWPV